MKKLNVEMILSIAMLLFAVGFNLWLYKLEPTATIDPNDNAFQFALVDRTNTMWDFAFKKCSSTLGGLVTFPICHFSYMADHWVNNWAEGLNLPFYYSHIPQITIVATWRFIHLFMPQMSLFAYYHIVIYLLLSLFPISVYLALLVMQVSPLTAGIGAIFATNLSTDGLYGLDPSSFLWRGYGLSSQLFAMTWLPLAIAYSYRFFISDRRPETGDRKKSWKASIRSLTSGPLPPAIIFVAATTAGHLGIGMIALLSLGFMAVAAPVMGILRQQNMRDNITSLKDQLIRLVLVAGPVIFLLGYWIIPLFIYGNYHNISFWDPVWKFNSYGAKETITRLFNGDLFDWGRLPVITYLTLLGVLVGLLPKEGNSESTNHESGIMNHEKNRNSLFPIHNSLFPLSFLFIFWLLFYFGRTTWGGLIDLIPGMKDYHLSRFLVGVHAAGMLLSPIGFVWLAEFASRVLFPAAQKAGSFVTKPVVRTLVYILLAILLLPPVFKWTVTYNDLNDKLIIQANTNHAKVASDEAALFAKLRSLPMARIFAGRGGGFGKNFKVAETPYFMNLSTYGLPTTLWLPETWSMNSDTEQYFSEDQAKDYDLYNIRWVAAPPDQTAQPFWKQIAEKPTWKLYEVPTSGYFTVGVRPATISVNKINFMTLVHLWIQSDTPKNGLFPELTFEKNYPKPTGLPNFKMLDEVTYKVPDGHVYNIFSAPPVYFPPGVTTKEQFAAMTREQYVNAKLLGPEKDDTDMVLSTRVEVGNNCTECMVILKQTFHPSWRVWVDGKTVKPIIVFPFYIGIPVTAGTHTIEAAYQPSTLKMGLLYLTILTIVGIAVSALRKIMR